MSRYARTAYDLRSGTKLAPFSVSSRTPKSNEAPLPRHYVRDVVPVNDGADLRIITNFTDITVPRNAVVDFPRRPDGSTKIHATPPTLADVVPGDWIGTPTGDPPGPAGWQVVVSIARDSRHVDNVYTLTTLDNLGTTRNYRASATTKLEFPLPAEDRPRPRGYTVYGPYTRVTDGASFRFLMHPHGRGRWPRDIHPYTHGSPSGLYRAFDRGSALWIDFELEKGGVPCPADTYHS